MGQPHLPPAEERPVPAGRAHVAPYPSGDEHVAALFELIALQLGAAIASPTSGGARSNAEGVAESIEERRQAGLLDEAEEAAVARLRIERGEPAAIAARAAVFEARIAASRARAIELPLADAFDAWRLAPVERSIVATLIGVACSPVIARLARRAGTIVEAVAAMIAPGHAGVLAIEACLAPGAALERLALVEQRGLERPLLEREIVAVQRLAALARGERALDPGLRGVTLVEDRDPIASTWAAPHALERLRGALARGTPLPIAWLASARGCGAGAIAADAALSLAWRALRVLEIADDPAWLDALAREALLHRAALVIDHPGEHAGAALDRLLRRVARLPIPVVVVDEAGGLGTALPAVHIELPLPSIWEREELWRRSLGAADRDCDLGELAAALRVGPEAIHRAAAHASLVADAFGRPVARADLVAGLRAQLPGALGLHVRAAHWDDDALARATGALLDRASDFEVAVRQRHAALAAVTGPAGSGKSLLASMVARALGLDLVELDAHGDERILEAAIVAAEQGLCLLAIDRADVAAPSRLRRLERVRGPVVAMARAPIGLACTMAVSLPVEEDS